MADMNREQLELGINAEDGDVGFTGVCRMQRLKINRQQVPVRHC